MKIRTRTLSKGQQHPDFPHAFLHQKKNIFLFFLIFLEAHNTIDLWITAVLIFAILNETTSSWYSLKIGSRSPDGWLRYFHNSFSYQHRLHLTETSMAKRLWSLILRCRDVERKHLQIPWADNRIWIEEQSPELRSEVAVAETLLQSTQICDFLASDLDDDVTPVMDFRWWQTSWLFITVIYYVNRANPFGSSLPSI